MELNKENAFADFIDSMFSDFLTQHNLPSFREFSEKERARERIERADEFRAFEIVKEVLKPDIDTQRLFLDFARRHSSVLLDKKVSKSICRFYLSYMKNKKKYITIRDFSGEHEKIFINEVDDIYLYVDKLKIALNFLLSINEKTKSNKYTSHNDV